MYKWHEGEDKMKPTVLFSFCLMLIPFSFSVTFGDISLKEIRTAPDALVSGEAHIQGICCNDDAIFLSFKNVIFKIDWFGNVLKSVAIQPHAGDLVSVDGHVFVSMSEPERHGVFEYDSELNFLAKYRLEKSPATDGIAFLDGNFFIGGPSVGQKPHFDNNISQFDRNFHLIRQMTINFDEPTHFGTQAIEACDGSLIMAFYTPNEAQYRTIRTDSEMNLLEKYTTFAANGIARVPPTKQVGDVRLFLIANTEYTENGHPIAILRWFELKDGTFIDVTAE